MNSIENKDIAQILIDRGVSIKAKDVNRNTALHFAIRQGDDDVVRLLLDKGSNPFKKNRSKDDAFKTASLRGRRSVSRILMEKFKPSVKF